MASRLLETVVREAYGRVLAGLLASGFPLHLAEDALGGALARAAETWAAEPPEHPVAWLHTVARRRAIDLRRSESRLQPLTAADNLPTEPLEDVMHDRVGLDFSALDRTDERLRLFYLCSHPALEVGVRTPLMLQLVMGMSAEELAPLFLMEPATLGQRLVRAKQKIRLAAIRPELPSAAELPSRTEAVRDAIYGLYLRGWEQPQAERQTEFANLAERLSQTVADLAHTDAVPPDAALSDPESDGLAALILLSEARRAARRTAGGAFIPLLDQSPDAWDRDRIARGEEYLLRASRARRPGRFQLEAAIESAWMSRVRTGQPGWEFMRALYDGLVRVAPTYGAQLGRLMVQAESGEPEAALRALDALPEARSYPPYWVLRAHLLGRVGRDAESSEARRQAHSMTTDPAVRDFLAGGS
ncbi:MAG: DUF6596 domain-containing protein [Fimbriimonadaceae bacterium]|nr:DUF6596 domain-containing protein [Fimbriimonadaceae bacterium]